MRGKLAPDITHRSFTLWVEDHGEGIPPAEHEKIFERFYGAARSCAARPRAWALA